jgi:hypothetical protein
MGKDEPFQIDHHRKEDLLGNPEGLEDRVKDLLAARAVELKPARVSLRKAVTQIRLKVKRACQGPIHIGHHNGKSQPGGVVEQLMHQREPL